jgi:hypothetical protein
MPLATKKRQQKRRKSPLTPEEKGIIDQVILDSPGGLATSQERGLSQALCRPLAALKPYIEEAREKFVKRAPRYTDIHIAAAEKALANGDAKSLEVATRSSQWALENISAEGARVVDKETKETSGVKILVGVKIGGLADNA